MVLPRLLLVSNKALLPSLSTLEVGLAHHSSPQPLAHHHQQQALVLLLPALEGFSIPTVSSSSRSLAGLAHLLAHLVRPAAQGALVLLARQLLARARLLEACLLHSQALALAVSHSQSRDLAHPVLVSQPSSSNSHNTRHNPSNSCLLQVRLTPAVSK